MSQRGTGEVWAQPTRHRHDFHNRPGQLTRERKQKQFTKQELRERWDARVSAEERASIQNNLRNEISDAPKVSEMKAMDFAMQHCYERASIVTDKELLRHALSLLRKTWTVGNGSPPRMCWRKKSG